MAQEKKSSDDGARRSLVGQSPRDTICGILEWPRSGLVPALCPDIEVAKASAEAMTVVETSTKLEGPMAYIQYVLADQGATMRLEDVEGSSLEEADPRRRK